MLLVTGQATTILDVLESRKDFGTSRQVDLSIVWKITN